MYKKVWRCVEIGVEKYARICGSWCGESSVEVWNMMEGVGCGSVEKVWRKQCGSV